MRIGIDTQALQGAKTGYGQYLSSLFAEFKKMNSGHELVEVHGTAGDLNTPRRILWDQFQRQGVAHAQKVDVLFVPAFSAPFVFDKPVVVTAHDIIGRLFPQNFSFTGKIYWHTLLPKSFTRADAIIADSTNTKNDLVKHLHIAEEKISVIPVGVDGRFKQLPKNESHAVREKLGIGGRPFLLFVGTIEPRKNVPFLVDAFAAVRKKVGSDLALVIIGKKGWDYDRVQQKVTELGLQNDVIIPDYLDAVSVVQAYNEASALVYASLYEGFGMPLLEAMACGCPVVTANTSSLPEVAGDAASVVALQQDVFVDAIVRVLRDPALQESMRAKGLERVKQFNWSDIARRTMNVIEKAHTNGK